MRMDINLGDLGYRIPFGQARDLLSPTARLSPEKVERSRLKGSIRRRLDQRVLIEVRGSPDLSPPLMSVADPQDITFPNRAKTGIVVAETDVAEEVQSSIIAEDDELLEEMEREFEEDEDSAAGAPLMVSSPDDREEEKKED